MRTNITFRFWLPFAWTFPAPARFVCDLFFGTSVGAHPLNRFCHPLGHPWPDFLHCLKDVRSSGAPNVKDSRAAFRYFVNKWHQSHLQQTKTHTNYFFTTQTEQIRTQLFFCVKKGRRNSWRDNKKNLGREEHFEFWASFSLSSVMCPLGGTQFGCPSVRSSKHFLRGFSSARSGTRSASIDSRRACQISVWPLGRNCSNASTAWLRPPVVISPSAKTLSALSSNATSASLFKYV